MGFDIVEISSGFITISSDDWLRLVDKVQKSGLKAKPEVGIQFGAGGRPARGGAGRPKDSGILKGLSPRPNDSWMREPTW